VRVGTGQNLISLDQADFDKIESVGEYRREQWSGLMRLEVRSGCGIEEDQKILMKD
jgi:hypothetical protein